jgi:3-methyladenine DNA glycosylase AlkD
MVLEQIRKELKKNIDPEYKEGCFRFFKESIKLHGVRTGIVRKIASKYFKLVDKDKVLDYCEELLKTGYTEETIIAFAWGRKVLVNEKDFNILEKWLKTYVNNWGFCDDLCTHLVGDLLMKYPSLVSKVKKWVTSKSRWVKRAAAVSFVVPGKKGMFFKEIFWIADQLLMDKDDLVQKGYGWMLKEASNFDQKRVFDFVCARKDKMPRTALRYAIEKMPPSLRKKAMS